ncbi:hypothetical protein [Micromonospora siamensis]|uniref:hypothetical protein n=1 Tax=Micromonospora siamensis TaxID=299152 RepID=UPI0012FDE41F|nr:hypothetical protein [Micromonospora siamensis]
MRRTADRALRRQRVAVVLAVVVGVLAGLVVRWQPAGPLGATLVFVAMLLPVGVLAYGLFRWPGQRGLRVGDDAAEAYAPGRGVPLAALVIVGWLPAQLAQYEGRWERDVPAWLLTAAALAAMGYVGAGTWRRAARLALTPAGIGWQGWQRRPLFVPWVALDPTMPIHAVDGDGRLRLFLGRPELVDGRRRERGDLRLWIGDLDVSPSFLAAAIRHYRAHPEHRAAIGSPGERDRLVAVLGG